MGASTEIGKYQLLPALAADVAGVRHGQRFICEDILPPAKVEGEEFRRELDGNEGMLDVPGVDRAMDTEAAEIDMDTDFVDERLGELALTTKVDYRKVNAARYADMIRAASGQAATSSAEDRLIRRRAMKLARILQIKKEKAAAAIVFASGSYDATLRTTSVDFGAAGVVGSIDDARWAVHDTYGAFPDTLVLGKTSLKELRLNDDVLERILGAGSTNDPSLVTLENMAKLFMVRRVVIGSATVQTKAAPGEAGTVSQIWTADSAALLYTGMDMFDPEGVLDPDDDVQPVFGRTYFMNVPETGVRFKVARWMNDSGKIHKVEVTEFAAPKLVIPAGFYFGNTDQA